MIIISYIHPRWEGDHDDDRFDKSYFLLNYLAYEISSFTIPNKRPIHTQKNKKNLTFNTPCHLCIPYKLVNSIYSRLLDFPMSSNPLSISFQIHISTKSHFKGIQTQRSESINPSPRSKTSPCSVDS